MQQQKSVFKTAGTYPPVSGLKSMIKNYKQPNLCVWVTAFLLLALFSGCASVQGRLFDWAVSFERGLSDLESRSVQVDQKSMHYLEREGAGDTIVLIHGFRANKDNWIRFVRSLPSDFRVIAIDLPAHGDNYEDPEVAYTPRRLMQGTAQIIDVIGIDRFHLVGNSLGGWVSELYTIQHADRVVSLGLFNSGGFKSSQPGGLETALRKGENPFSIKTTDDFYKLQDMAFYEPPFLPWPVRPVMARQFVSSNAFYEKMLQDMIMALDQADNETMAAGLAAADVPIFVLWGDHDDILPVSLVTLYKQYFPKVETVVMKDCGHLPMVERPGEAAEHYTHFVQKYLLRPLNAAQ